MASTKTKAKAAKTIGSATYVRALAGDERERKQLREAYRSGRKAYGRASRRSGGIDVMKLIEDRRARRNASATVVALQGAADRARNLRRRRKQKRNGGVIAVVAVTGAGTVVLLNKGVRDKLLRRDGDQASSPQAA